MKKCALMGMTVLSVGAFALSAAADSNYPTGPVTLIVPFGAGGGTDNLVRTIQPVLEEALGQSVVVENRPGGGSTIGTEAAVSSAADGYTVLITDSAVLVNPGLYDELPYDTLADLDPVSMLATGPVVLVAHPDAQAQNVDDLIELADENPGTIPFASGGHGASTHLALELMQLVADIEVIHVPYGGTGPARTDIVAGHVDYMFDGISGARPHLDSGALNALAVTSDERHPALPDVPTFAELGYPGIDPMSIWGAWVPAGTSEDIIETLSEAFHTAINHESVEDRLIELGYFAIGSSPAEYGERAAAEMERWADVIDSAGIEVD